MKVGKGRTCHQLPAGPAGTRFSWQSAPPCLSACCLKCRQGPVSHCLSRHASTTTALQMACMLSVHKLSVKSGGIPPCSTVHPPNLTQAKLSHRECGVGKGREGSRGGGEVGWEWKLPGHPNHKMEYRPFTEYSIYSGHFTSQPPK